MKTSRTRSRFFNGIFITAIGLSSSLTLAQEFQFKFSYYGKTWDHPVTAENWSAALEIASQDCISHFTGSQGTNKVKVDQATADSLLNTCINPR